MMYLLLCVARQWPAPTAQVSFRRMCDHVYAVADNAAFGCPRHVELGGGPTRSALGGDNALNTKQGTEDKERERGKEGEIIDKTLEEVIYLVDAETSE